MLGLLVCVCVECGLSPLDAIAAVGRMSDAKLVSVLEGGYGRLFVDKSGCSPGLSECAYREECCIIHKLSSELHVTLACVSGTEMKNRVHGNEP